MIKITRSKPSRASCSSAWHDAIASTGDPEWEIKVTPYDLDTLAANIAALFDFTPVAPKEEPSSSRKEAEPLPWGDDEDDDEGLLGASTLAKLRSAKLFEEEEK